MKRKVFTGILTAIFLLQLAAEGVAAYAVFRLNMLPALYGWIFVGVLVLAAAVTGVVMFLPKRDKASGLICSIIGILLAVLIMIGCGFGFYIANDVFQTMKGITTPSVSTVTRSVFVRTEDPAHTLVDTADYTFAAVENYDVDSTQQAIKVIETELEKTVKVTYFVTIPEMVDALYSGQVDAIILNSAYVLIIEDMEGYQDFSQKARILHDVPVAEWTPPPKETEPVEEETKPAKPVERNITNTPFVVYISGSDTNNSYLPTSTRSDVNILAVVNPETKQVLLLNTPRDYYVENPAGGGARDKLTHCGIYGVDCSIKALEILYSTDIDYNARINFTGFKTLIDAIGGITVYSDKSFTTYAGTYVGAGENYFNGAEALAFARERYRLAGGDNARGNNQMKVIKAVITKMTSGTTIISNYADILASMQGMFATSMPMEDISRLVKMQLTDMASWDVHTYAVTGQDGSATTYSSPGLRAYVMYVNEAQVAHASELIDMVLEGKILTEADISGTK